MKNHTMVERKSEKDLAVTRTFNAPARLVYRAWTQPELIQRWWVPRSSGASLVSCEMDVRVGGSYRFVFEHPATQPMAFFGRYIEASPPSLLVWTNEESEAGPLTTVTFDGLENQTLLIMNERYPSKEALDGAIEGMRNGMREPFEQLDALLLTLPGA